MDSMVPVPTPHSSLSHEVGQSTTTLIGNAFHSLDAHQVAEYQWARMPELHLSLAEVLLAP